MDYYCRLLTHQLAYMILLRVLAILSGYGLLPETLMRPGGLSNAEIIQWSSRLTDSALSQLYGVYPDRRLFTLMAHLRREVASLDNELARRLEDKPLERELLLLDWGGEDRREAITRELDLHGSSTHVRNHHGKSILKSRPKGETVEDDLQTAILTALEGWKRPARIPTEPRPLPPLPFHAEFVLPDERAFWEGPLANAWHIGREAIRREAMPILTGKRQSIGRRARNVVSNAWDTTMRRHAKTAAQMDDIRKALPACFNSPDHLLQGKTLAQYLYRTMRERHGEKGCRYLDGRFMGKNKTDPSDYAGVSWETGRKYLQTLLEIVSENKPAD